MQPIPAGPTPPIGAACHDCTHPPHCPMCAPALPTPIEAVVWAASVIV